MNDQKLAELVRDSAPVAAAAPDFAAVFGRANDQLRARRRRRLGLFGSGVAAAALVLLLSNGPVPTPEPEFVQMSDLLDSTSWAAPSDVLLPTRQIDIYQDLPTLTRSTTPVEGALL